MIKLNTIFKYDQNLNFGEDKEEEKEEKLNWKFINIYNYNEKLDFSKFLIKNIYISNYSIFEKHKDCIVYKHEKQKNNIFLIFDIGIIITWGMNLNDEIKLIKNINNISNLKLDYNDLICDSYNFIKKKKEKFKLVGNYLYLNSNLVYEKIILSYIFVQDAFLDLCENEIEKYTKDCKMISIDLINNKIKKTNKNTIFKKIGNVYLLLNKIMFKKGILDNPKLIYFKEYEQIFNKISFNLNIDSRTQILIKKIRMTIEFYSNIKSDHYFNKEFKLELIVLLLVIIYTVIYFIKYLILK